MTPMGERGQIYDSDVPEWMAKQMASVGILPSYDPEDVGSVLVLAGQPFKVTGHATKTEFLAAVVAAGYCPDNFMDCPVPFYLKITTG